MVPYPRRSGGAWLESGEESAPDRHHDGAKEDPGYVKTELPDYEPDQYLRIYSLSPHDHARAEKLMPLHAYLPRIPLVTTRTRLDRIEGSV